MKLELKDETDKISAGGKRKALTFANEGRIPNKVKEKKLNDRK